MCSFCVSDSGAEDLAIFGDAVMSHYYIIFDHASDQVGFAPLVGSPTMKAAVVPGTTPKTSFAAFDAKKVSKISVPSKLTLVVIAVLVLLLTRLVYVLYRNSKLKPTVDPASDSGQPTASSTTVNTEVTQRLIILQI